MEFVIVGIALDFAGKQPSRPGIVVARHRLAAQIEKVKRRRRLQLAQPLLQQVGLIGAAHRQQRLRQVRHDEQVVGIAFE